MSAERTADRQSIPGEIDLTMINDTTNDLAGDETLSSEETPDQVEVERQGFSLAKSLRNPRTLISFGLAIAIVGNRQSRGRVTDAKDCESQRSRARDGRSHGRLPLSC